MASLLFRLLVLGRLYLIPIRWAASTTDWEAAFESDEALLTETTAAAARFHCIAHRVQRRLIPFPSLTHLHGYSPDPLNP